MSIFTTKNAVAERKRMYLNVRSHDQINFGFKEDDSERGNEASEDRRIRQLVIGFERRI
jgi:hypothetical protein